MSTLARQPRTYPREPLEGGTWMCKPYQNYGLGICLTTQWYRDAEDNYRSQICQGENQHHLNLKLLRYSQSNNSRIWGMLDSLVLNAKVYSPEMVLFPSVNLKWVSPAPNSTWTTLVELDIVLANVVCVFILPGKVLDSIAHLPNVSISLRTGMVWRLSDHHPIFSGEAIAAGPPENKR